MNLCIMDCNINWSAQQKVTRNSTTPPLDSYLSAVSIGGINVTIDNRQFWRHQFEDDSLASLDNVILVTKTTTVLLRLMTTKTRKQPHSTALRSMICYTSEYRTARSTAILCASWYSSTQSSQTYVLQTGRTVMLMLVGPRNHHVSVPPVRQDVISS